MNPQPLCSVDYFSQSRDGSNKPRSEVIPQSYGYANLFLFPLWKVSFFYLFSFWCGCRHVQMCGVTLTLITFSPFPLLIFISAHSLSPSSSHALALALTALMHAHARTCTHSTHARTRTHTRSVSILPLSISLSPSLLLFLRSRPMLQKEAGLQQSLEWSHSFSRTDRNRSWCQVFSSGTNP